MQGFRSLLGLGLLPLQLFCISNDFFFHYGTLGYIRNIMKSKRKVGFSLSSAIIGAHLSIWGQCYLASVKRNEDEWE